MLWGATWSAISFVKVLWRRLPGCLFGFSPVQFFLFHLEIKPGMVHSSYGLAEDVPARNAMNKLISDVEASFAPHVWERSRLSPKKQLFASVRRPRKRHTSDLRLKRCAGVVSCRRV